MRRCIIWTLLASGFLPFHAQADTLRCDSRLVSTGALAAEVLSQCGEPDYRDRWLYPHPYTQQYIGDTEEWYYNFGPSQLLRILRFENGQLAKVDADGYGFVERPKPGCAPGEIVEGLSKYRLLLRCGEPVTRESYNISRPVHRPDGEILRGTLQPVFQEQWVYNFGSRYFLKLVTFEDGRVVYVDSGERGFDAR